MGEITGLTPRQLEILMLIAKGLSNSEISELLKISQNTVKVHSAAIRSELGVNNRTEAAAVFHAAATTENSELQVANRIGRPAIGVLRFDELDSNGGSHFADGVREDLIFRLASWRWFPVLAIGPHDTDRYLHPGDNALESDAAYLVRGSIRRDASRTKLNVFLLEATNHTTVWSDVFDFDVETTLDMQERIAERIIACLAPELIAHEGYRAKVQTDVAFDAWQRTMLGMWSLAHRTQEEVVAAQIEFEAATELDQHFALPWFGLAWVHHHNIIEQWSNDPAASMSSLEHAVEQCVRLAPASAQTELVVGMREVLKGRRDSAVRHLERATYLNPSSTQALGLLGQCLCLTDRADNCIAMIEEALLLNPHNPNVWAQKSVIALAHFAAERHEDCLMFARQAVAAKPNNITANLIIVAALTELKEIEAAREVRSDLSEMRPDFDVSRYLLLVAPLGDEKHIERIKCAFRVVEAA